VHETARFLHFSFTNCTAFLANRWWTEAIDEMKHAAA